MYISMFFRAGQRENLTSIFYILFKKFFPQEKGTKFIYHMNSHFICCAVCICWVHNSRKGQLLVYSSNLRTVRINSSCNKAPERNLINLINNIKSKKYLFGSSGKKTDWNNTKRNIFMVSTPSITRQWGIFLCFSASVSFYWFFNFFIMLCVN